MNQKTPGCPVHSPASPHGIPAPSTKGHRRSALRWTPEWAALLVALGVAQGGFALPASARGIQFEPVPVLQDVARGHGSSSTTTESLLLDPRAEIRVGSRRGSNPEDLLVRGTPLFEVTARWSTWVADNGYRIELEEEGRCLLIVHERTSSTKKHHATLAKAYEAIDEAFPLRDAPIGGNPVGGDPDGDDPKRVLGQGDGTTSADPAPDSPEPPVLFELRTGDGQGALLDALTAEEPYLAEWSAYAKTLSGFTLEQPLCAAWRVDGPGLEEWDPKNELVHRLAHLELVRRYDRQPRWLTMGLCWQIEQEVQGDIYCFPLRSGFVSIAEHDGWAPKLKSMFKKRSGDPVQGEELDRLSNRQWNEDGAAVAWGAAGYLLQHRSKELPALLLELADFRREHGIRRFPDGRWELIPDYSVPPDEQMRIFTGVLGEGWRDELTRYFQQGRRFRPKH